MPSLSLMLVLTIVSTIVLTACSPRHVSAPPEAMPSTDAEAARAWRAAGDDQWQDRDRPEHLQAALARYEQAWEAGDQDVALRLAEGWTLRGRALETTPQARLAAWTEAITWGQRCANRNPVLRQVKAQQNEQQALPYAERADAGCLYWTALATQWHAEEAGRATVLKDEPQVLALMARVEELDPDLDHGGVDRFWGRRLARLPMFAGQSLSESRARFEHARDTDPQWLQTPLEEAVYWAAAAGDRASYRGLLQGLLQAEDDGIPENRLAQAQARSLLATPPDFNEELQ